MMNLDELRRSYTSKELFDYIDKNADKLYLGDQDVINALYCTKTRMSRRRYITSTKRPRSTAQDPRVD